MNSFIDGDFPSGRGECKYHCSPTCHPGQIDENKWRYGCLHLAWPANKEHDFCPLVDCDGDQNKCEIPIRLLSAMKRGAMARLKNARQKANQAGKDYEEYEDLINKIKASKKS